MQWTKNYCFLSHILHALTLSHLMINVYTLLNYQSLMVFGDKFFPKKDIDKLVIDVLAILFL